jgi:hypothetical protein
METVAAEVILKAAAGRATGKREVGADLFGTLKDALHDRLREGWRWQDWPDLRLVEKRYFREVWTAGTYAAGRGREVREEPGWSAGV